MQSQSNDGRIRTCGTCGNRVPADREARHPMGAASDVFCLQCERVHLSGDLDAANAALDILEVAASAALNGHVSPQDVAAAVARAISQMETIPQDTFEDIRYALRVNGDRLASAA